MTDNYEESFSEEQLRFAARQVRESLLASLPSPAECEHEFSEVFYQKMKALVDQEQRRQARRKLLQRVAAILLMFTLGFGTWLTVDAEAREAVFAWVREVYENSIVYRFFGGEEAERNELPQYAPSWLPEGYSEVGEFRDEDTYSAFYQQEDDPLNGFEFAYYKNNSDINWLIYLQIEGDAYVYERLQINGLPADLYICTDGSETNNLIWMAADQSVVFALNGFLDKQELLRIARFVVLNGLTK